VKRQRKNSKYYRYRLLLWVLLILVMGSSVSWYYVTRNSRLETEFAQAESLVQGGSYEKARKKFFDIYETSPDSSLAPQALYRSGDILNVYLDKYQEAILAFLLVTRDYPDSEWAVQAQKQVAEIYKTRLLDYAQAIVAYQKLLDSGVADADRTQYEIADAYFRLNNYEQARIEFESLLKNYPDSPLVPEVQYRIALAYSLDGQLTKAEAVFKEVISTWPEDLFALEARFGLASVLEEEERLRESLKVLQDLQGVYPNKEALTKKIRQVEERIRKKKKAI